MTRASGHENDHPSRHHGDVGDGADRRHNDADPQHIDGRAWFAGSSGVLVV